MTFPRLFDYRYCLVTDGKRWGCQARSGNHWWSYKADFVSHFATREEAEAEVVRMNAIHDEDSPTWRIVEESR
jgi:hypothetical protein